MAGAGWRDVLSGMPEGAALFVAGAAAEPTALLERLAEDPAPLAGRRVVTTFLPGINRPDPTAGAPGARVQTIFPLAGTSAERQSLVPLSYTGFARWLGGAAGIGAVVLQVAPAEGGAVSLGLTADFVPPLIEAGLPLIGQLNPALPALPGAPRLPRDRFAALVEADSPTVGYDPGPPGPVFEAIARHVAGLLRPGDRLQLGLGKVQAALLAALRDGPSPLAIHGGMLSGGALDLFDEGLLTGAEVGVVIGDGGLYARAGELAGVRLSPVAHTHAAATLAGLGPFVSVNSVIAVDLAGQATAESVEGRTVSAAGGLMDFHRAARTASGGRAILALPATAKGRSRIVPTFAAGTRVSVPAPEAGVVVTEHGVADLGDQDAAARAEALIAIAAPEHRAALRAAACATVRA